MITTYTKDTTEYNNLDFVASVLNELAMENRTTDRFKVIDCYWDFGADMMWTTIQHSYVDNGYRSTYQMLYPNQHEAIINGTWEDNYAVALELWKNRIGGGKR